jgi:hypothetical protein
MPNPLPGPARQVPFWHVPLLHSTSVAHAVRQAFPTHAKGAQSVVVPSGWRSVRPSASQVVLVGTQSESALSQR